MLKRVTKVVSLVVAAASITSMVPAMAADLKEADIMEDTIYSATAEGNNRYIIDAELNNEDKAFYFLADGKYTKLDIDADYTLSGFFENKYAGFKDDKGNYYYVDVSTGKQIEEYDSETQLDNMERKLKKSIKKDNDGRFRESDYTNNTIKANVNLGGDPLNVYIAGATGIWSKFTYNLNTANTNGETTSTILSDINGNYIDADYNLGKINIYTTTGSSVTFTNTKNTIEIEENGKKYELKAQIKNENAFDEEPDAIYRTAVLTIWRKEKGAADDKYENITDKVELGGKDNHHSQVPYNDGVRVIQKISKAQASETVDGIKYSKDVMTCFITDRDGNEAHVFGLGDVSDLDTSVDWSGGDVALITGSMTGIASHFYDASEKKYYAQNLELKSYKGYYYVSIGKYDETDADAWTIGGGNLYCLGNGYVKKWINKDGKFEKLYRVDGGMSTLSATNDDNVIVWDKDKDIYSILYNKASDVEHKDAGVVTTTVGWVKATDGTWTYSKADGTKAIGWLKDGANWYYLKSDGIMAIGWINDRGIWYYCNESGVMLTNTTVDRYTLGADGAWIQ
jgi:FOG: Glucan-binding domain (YG repeat)